MESSLPDRLSFAATRSRISDSKPTADAAAYSLSLLRGSVKIMRNIGIQAGKVEAIDAPGFDVDGAIAALGWTFDDQERLAGDLESLHFEEGWRDNRVADARFVFQTYEANPLGCARALTADDHSTNAHLLAVLHLFEISRTPEIGHAVADEGHRMRTSRQTQAGIIGLKSLEGVHSAQR